MSAIARTRSNLKEIFAQAVDSSIREHGEVGLHLAIYQDDELVVDEWGGVADPLTGRKVESDTLFPVFSVTKAVTATALHIQAERGLVEYDTPIAHYWPEFAAHGKDKTTVRDALSHRTGIPQMPEGVTPAQMANYEWMVEQLAQMKPWFEPGTTNAYHCYSFGWIVAEIVRRTDPKRRPFGAFVQEEVCAPLGIHDIHIGIPDGAEPRVARLIDPSDTQMPPDAPFFKCIPPPVGCFEAVFGRPDVRRACIPGAGGIMNAREVARLFAMLANEGELDGVRMLSAERVCSFSKPRPNTELPDAILGFPVRVGTAGYWLGGPTAPSVVGSNPRTLHHPGAGGSIGWANPHTRLAGAICHNRMFNAPQDPFGPIAEAIRRTFGD
ncbi:MAG TPA: serine hydrolase domain-containing protein [Candidatus Binataceae bacterium]|nr:serine hydrolase domain-containing protein [Candidatus Binataceae bacterium]